MDKRVYVIAEAGVNHNGDIDRAFELIDVASQAGADAVKFQTFDPGKLVASGAPKAEYQQESTASAESQQEMLEDVRLPREVHPDLKQHCDDRGIEFLSSPFDSDALTFLVEDIGMKRIKIPSGEITNGPLLYTAGNAEQPVILSTGMSTIGEIKDALAVLSHGFLYDTPPDESVFNHSILNEGPANEYLRNNVSLLHCVSEYPAPPDEVNLRAMDVLREEFGLPVGFSDHTEGIAIPLGAVGRGASVLEKHFTLDRSLPGPDHQSSLEPDELTRLIEGVRSVEIAFGDEKKQPSSSEKKNMDVVRKSLVASRPIEKGELFSEKNLATKRPGTGISPMKFWDYLGNPAERTYEEDDMI